MKVQFGGIVEDSLIAQSLSHSKGNGLRVCKMPHNVFFFLNTCVSLLSCSALFFQKSQVEIVQTSWQSIYCTDSLLEVRFDRHPSNALCV